MAIETSASNILMYSLITFACFAVAISILVFLRRWLSKIAGKTKTRIDDFAVMLFRGPITVFIIVLTSVFIVRFWDTGFPGMFPVWVSTNLDVTTVSISILVATSIIALLINGFLGTHVKRIIAESPETETTYQMISRTMVGVIYLIGVLVAITTAYPGALGSLTTLLFGAGFLAIVIGLAAQRVIGNLLSGINVSLTRPIRLGDAVVIKGEFGFVEDIGLRHTFIRTWDNRRMVIPNSILDDEVIINYTARDPKKLFGITVGVPYDTNIDKVAEIMKGEAKMHPNVLPELEPIFQVLDFGEGAITLRLLFLAKDQPTAFGTGCDLRRSIKTRFDEESIKISCPSRYVIRSGESVHTLNVESNV